ncbi:MAG: 3'(2'),5'-bisphosphate nucleotidase CysQ [Planctomycetota bacterium]
MNADEIQRDLRFAIEIAQYAGRRSVNLRATERWEGKQLADVCDHAADGLLQGFLRGRYPDDAILSEETKDSPERLSAARTWIVDPLDGTKEFSQGRHDWAVHVALTIDGAPAIGVVGLPCQNATLWGVTIPGHEAAGVEGEPLPTIRGDSPSPAQPKLAASRSHTPRWIESFAGAFGAELLRCGSVGYKVSRLLVGEADLYVHKRGLKEWDTCAPETVARALGWHVSKLRGDEHTYNRPDPKNHELVICRPAVKDRVLAAIAASGALED